MPEKLSDIACDATIDLAAKWEAEQAEKLRSWIDNDNSEMAKRINEQAATIQRLEELYIAERTEHYNDLGLPLQQPDDSEWDAETESNIQSAKGKP